MIYASGNVLIYIWLLVNSQGYGLAFGSVPFPEAIRRKNGNVRFYADALNIDSHFPILPTAQNRLPVLPKRGYSSESTNYVAELESMFKERRTTYCIGTVSPG